MSSSLHQFSHELAEIVQKAATAIVRVDARRQIPASGIFWSENGHIVTANHVVRRDENIIIGLPDGQSVEAKLIGRDPTTDVAVLHVVGSISPLPPAEEAGMGVGHIVLAMGRPGRNVEATCGIISAAGGEWRTRMGGRIESYLQTDVVMYPGFSGGPLVGASGQLLGMNTSGLSQGVSLAIPHGTISTIVAMLSKHGRIRRGYLGVSTQRVRLPSDLSAELNQKTGLLIISVETDSPAAAAGLTLGDTILTLGDRMVHDHHDLMAALTGELVGEKQAVRILRGGQVLEFIVRIRSQE